ELARLEVENAFVLEGETNQIRRGKLRRDVENFLHDGGVLPRTELHRRLVNHLFLRHRSLRRSGLPHHVNAGTLQANLNIVLGIAEVRIHAHDTREVARIRAFFRGSYLRRPGCTTDRRRARQGSVRSSTRTSKRRTAKWPRGRT